MNEDIERSLHEMLRDRAEHIDGSGVTGASVRARAGESRIGASTRPRLTWLAPLGAAVAVIVVVVVLLFGLPADRGPGQQQPAGPGPVPRTSHPAPTRNITPTPSPARPAARSSEPRVSSRPGSLSAPSLRTGRPLLTSPRASDPRAPSATAVQGSAVRSS